MPARQRGAVDKLAGEKTWRARWYDEHGNARGKRGFRTKSEARAWLENECDRVDRERRGDSAIRPEQLPTLQALVDEFLAQHSAEQSWIDGLGFRLAHATAKFGELRIDRLTVPEIAAWRKRLSPGTAWQAHKALRQVLSYAVRAKYIPANVAQEVPNPEPKRTEIIPFDSVKEVDQLAAELSGRNAAIIVFATETGLRPEEWIALEWRDLELDRESGRGVAHVSRVYTYGELKHYGKTDCSLRTVFLTRRAVAALGSFPRRIDTPLVFPGARGGHVNLNTWRNKHWNPAVEASGLHLDAHGRLVKRRTPYSMRHTFATWAIASGTDLFTLARWMGTSYTQIEKTYGHLVSGSLERGRTSFEAWQDSREHDQADEERAGWSSN